MDKIIAWLQENYFPRGSFQSWNITSQNSQQVPNKDMRLSN
jgi:hypothetical protein